MKQRGAVLVDPARHPARRASTTTTELDRLLYEFKADLNAYLAALGAAARRCKTLADVIAFNEAARGAKRCPTSARSCS